MEITIRKALPEDARDYSVCHFTCWQSAYRGIVPDDYLHNMWQSIEQRTERYKDAFSNPDAGEYYCVLIAERMIGFFFINKSKDEDKPHAGEIVAIYLLEEYWGKGTGRILLDYSVDKLRQMGHGEVTLWTFEDNIRARRFYEKCGFSFDGAKKEMALGKPLTLVRYVLEQPRKDDSVGQ